MQQAALNSTIFWTGDNPGWTLTITTNTAIPTGTSTIIFTFHQSYDNFDGTERIYINLATNGCEAYPIDSTPPTQTPPPTLIPTVTPTNPALPTPPPASIFSHAEFTYNGDGQRVKSALTTNLGTTTTYFVGAHYEVTDGVVTKYYYAGTQRIAMRSNGTLYLLIGDHLGSTSLTTFANGNVVSETRYKAWGEVRYASGTTPTNYTFTGQYSHATTFGLMFYNARWYDPYLNHFTQPDSIVPDPYNPQTLNRYSYTLNNPIRYTDPTGHRACDDQDENGNCIDYELKNKRLHNELKRFVAPERVEEDEMVNSYWGAHLAPEEVDVLGSHFGWGPEPLLMYNWMNLAGEKANKWYPDLDGDGFLLNDPGDAYRHAYWNALITRVYGEDFARDFTTAHETEASNAADAREQSFMDLHNNEVGIQIALSNPSASKEELEVLVYDALQAGQLYVWDGSDIYYSDACPYCIYP